MIGCLVNFIEDSMFGVRLRPSGGVYFVKKDYLDVLDNLEKWIKEIGADITISRIKLIDEKRTVDEVAVLFVQKIKEDIDEIKKYTKQVVVEDLRKNTAGINTRLEKLERMKKELELYLNIIGETQKEELEKQLEEVRSSMFLLSIEK